METVKKSTLTERLIAYKSDDASRKFWEGYLPEEIDEVRFSDYQEIGLADRGMAQYHFTYSPETTQLVGNICRNFKSFQVFMNASISLLVYKLTAKTQLVIGNHVETSLNDILPVSVAVDPKMAFSSFISTLAKSYQEALSHGNYPVALLHEQKNGKENAFFNIGLLFNEQPDFEDHHPELAFRFNYATDGSPLQCTITLDQSIYTADFANLLFASLDSLLINGLTDVKAPVESIGLLNKDQEARINSALNTTKVPYPADTTIAAEFDRVVDQFPDRIALTKGREQLRYRELSRKVDVMAAHLQATGVQADSRVAVLMEMSIEYIITILAILKAGGSYVPMAVSNPSARTLELLEDIDPRHLVIRQTDAEKTTPVVASAACQTIVFEELDFGVAALEVQQQAGQEAYIMFTSGSTGKPKGVQIPHKAVLRLVKNTNFVHLDEHTRTLLTGASTFDATTFEIWGCLLNGGNLCLADQRQLLDSDEFRKLLDAHEINTLLLTSPLFNQLVDQSKDNLFATVKYLIVGGDVLSPEHIHRVRAQNPAITVVNGYGPTENTTFSVTTEVDDRHQDTIPLGKPINNSTAYVLDHDLKMVPSDIWGILYVGGDGLANGYLNQPALTDQKFIPNPYGPGTLYKTDDVVKLGADLSIIFKGRNDNQVKIRGFRIETGEIEHHLKSHPQVNNCLVKPHGQGAAKTLLAYFTADETLSSEELKQYLATRVTEYMVPSYFLQLDKFPLTLNGKVDHKSLPAPASQEGAAANAVLTKTEQELATLWSGILGLPASEITADSDFFELGGHSLSAMSLLSQVQQRFAVKISIEKLYGAAKLQVLAGLLEEAGPVEKLLKIPQADASKDYYEVSSAQKRMFILQQLSPENIAYNITTHSVLPQDMDLVRMKECLHQILERHESFRTNFVKKSGKVYQVIAYDVAVTVQEFAGTEPDCRNFIKDFTRPFDLTNEPLVRLAIVRPETGPVILAMDMHHIIADGVSQELFLKEFNELYQGKTLAARSEITYKDYAEWQNTTEYQESLVADKAYWHQQLAEEIPDLGLATDHSRPVVKGYEGDVITFDLEGQQLTALRHLMNKSGVSLSTAMMALWSVTVSRFAKSRKLIVGMPVSGRSHYQLEQVVGMFVNMLPVKCDVEATDTFEAFLTKVKQTIAIGLSHQNYQFEDLLDDLNVPRDTSRNPLFDVSLNVLKSSASWEMYQQEAAGKGIVETVGVSKFDLTLNVVEFDSGCACEIEFAKELFEKASVEKFKTAFLKLLATVLEDSTHTLGEIDLLSDKEHQLVRQDFNSYQLSYEQEPVTTHLRRQSQEDGTAVAVLDSNGALSYESLRQMATLVAQQLLSVGITKGEVVGLSMTSSKEVAIAMYGIMMAGGQFMPFDPDLPLGRVENMLQQAGATYVISDGGNEALATVANLLSILALTDDSKAGTEISHQELPELTLSDAAYVIFTSGTTGVPNGVQVSHGALLNLCAWHCDYYQVTSGDRASKYASLSFDATVWEIFPYLYKGASLYFSDPKDKFELKILNEKFEENEVSIAFLPTQIGEKFTELSNQTLKKLLLGGDKLKQVSFQNDYRIYNNYGPTENAVVATAGEVLEGEDSISIGRPIANCEMLILYPEFDQPTPVNVIGELCIAGASLADGYINNEPLTAQSFVPHPFRKGERMYRTGDLGKWLPNGEIAFVGRGNDQVSIRGFRIELGEIEQQIAQMPEVEEVAVVCNNAESDNPQLCCYFTAAQDIDSEAINQHLIGKIPGYMMPNYVMKLTEMPVNTSGKIDKSRLPEPAFKKVVFELPANEVEEKLIMIWSDLLSMPAGEISTRQNFFEIGGNSMKVLNLKDRIFEDLRVDIPVVSLFEFTTIQSLAVHLTDREKEEAAELERLEEMERDSLEVLDETLQNLNFE